MQKRFSEFLCISRLVTVCLANVGSVACSSVLMFSLSLSGVRPGVSPGVPSPRGVTAPPAWGVMPSEV